MNHVISKDATGNITTSTKSVVDSMKSTTRSDGVIQFGKEASSFVMERFQKEMPPVDTDHYAESSVNKIASEHKITDSKKPKRQASKSNELLEKILFDAKKQVLVSSKSNSKEVASELAEVGPKRKCIPANIIAIDLLGYYSFGVVDNQLYMYEEKHGYWKMIQASSENRALRALIPEEYKPYINKNALSEIYEWIRIEAKALDTGNLAKYYLNFRDCAVDWRTEKIVKDRKNLHFDYYLDLNYLELDMYQNGEMKKYLDGLFDDDKKTKKEFAKFFGLCLSSIRNLKLCFFLYGPSNTGKSVTLNLLKLLVGEQWTSSVSFSQLSSEFAITRMIGKKLNVTGEVSGTSNRRLDVFKSLTGNDDIEICFKGKDYFTYSNKCLLVFACNNFPQIQDIPEFQSFLSRLVIFPFNNQKPRSEWIDNLEKVLLSDAKAVIKFAMEGLKMLEKDDFQIYETEAMEACKREFIGIYDSFSLFADKYLAEDPDSKVASREIENSYRNFCFEESLMAQNINIWGQVLKQKFRCRQCTVLESTQYGTKKRVRGYQGIRLKDVNEIEESW